MDELFGTKLITKTQKDPWLKIDVQDVYFVHDIVLFGVNNVGNVGPMLDLNIRIGQVDR